MKRISAFIDAVMNAALWVREKYNLPDYAIIVPEFEKEFDCEVIMEGSYPSEIEFEDESKATMFLLKWS